MHANTLKWKILYDCINLYYKELLKISLLDQEGIKGNSNVWSDFWKLIRPRTFEYPLSYFQLMKKNKRYPN